jgi:hypothetical protein
MTLATEVSALLAMVRRQDVEELSPAERQRFAALCRHVAAFAERPPSPAKSGVLSDLKTGRKHE